MNFPLFEVATRTLLNFSMGETKGRIRTPTFNRRQPILIHKKLIAQTKKSNHTNAPAKTPSGFDPKAALYWLAVTFAALGLGYGIATKTDLVAGILSGMLVALIVRKKMTWGIMGILFLPVIGELYRLPVGGDTGTLISDVAIGVLAILWAVEKIRLKKPFPKNEILKPLMLFCLVAAFSLLFSLTFLKFTEVAAGSLYLFRFIEYVLLGVITLDSVKTPKDAHHILTAMAISALIITVAGFIQLIVYPDMGKLEEYGWDPHQNRLVSTWLDPNFIAGLLGFMLSIAAAGALYAKSFMKRIVIVIIVAVFAVALFLTYSRSGYVAAAAALGIVGILKSRKLLIGSIIVMIVGLNFLPRAQERVDDLMHSIQSFVFNTNENPDATARLRIVSWNQTIELIQKRPLLGSGYNTLKYVKYDEGFVRNTEIHSASGSDSSLLTIAATTGIMGLVPFMLLYWNMLKLSFQNWKNKKIPAEWQGYGLGLFAGTIGLLFHSLFVNSLLFPQIMIFFWTGTGLLFQKSLEKKPTAAPRAVK